jgi:hypothetical protein
MGATTGGRRRSPVFVDRVEVRETLGLASNATLARWVERGWCPSPARWLTPTRPVWARKDWEQWVKTGRQSASGDQSPRAPDIQSSADDASRSR